MYWRELGRVLIDVLGSVSNHRISDSLPPIILDNISADDILKYFFLICKENILCRFILIVPQRDSLHEISKFFFMGKIKKISSVCCLLN